MSTPELYVELHGGDLDMYRKGGDLSPEWHGWPDLMDCAASGDVEDTCAFFLSFYPIDWKVTDADLTAWCQRVYFDSEADFSDPDTCRLYALWSLAADAREMRE